MNVGVNYMREHMPSDARVHYAVLDTGGIAPNVVQAHARVRYSIRARDLPGMLELVERVKKDRAGRSAHDRDDDGDEDRQRRLQRDGQHAAGEGDARRHRGTRTAAFRRSRQEFAAQIRATLSDKDIASAYRAVGMETDAPLADFTVPLEARRNPMIGSTDVGDVSWVTPTVQVHAPTVAIGTPFHTWQIVAQGKQPAAHKAMVQAAKAMAATGAAALLDPT